MMQTIQSIIPHWTDFVDAIRSSNPDNQFWTFDKIQLSPAMMDILRQLMMSRSIHRLEFNNGYSDDETNERAIFNLLIGILEKNTTELALHLMLHQWEYQRYVTFGYAFELNNVIDKEKKGYNV